MEAVDLVAEFPQPARTAALPRCSSGLRPCQISMFLSLKCLNTRSSHLRAHGRKMVPKILSLLVKDGAPKAFII
uniref:Uncharacterized protein n=2 Tax=Sus scrofa TaxID=9823 RepID=A0A4X1VSG7_PIG